ncbi:MAG: 1-(5-phosphoribosyl)-5-[(5-phosphoribosylamino)methylideneamino]imidazole-4-carboxamide isomerase [Elusimicrobia bacterium RIFOXYD2_FULL_34_15]|nr:MAG: 1-(5-phosphoribosyl)-5-[(5-phosphoribosylamino)methylideneamino]imidazole-4-carboxamide isomerase [Elusimicrobia bacterium RIFOXYD2_FULL_34_15]
MLIIPAIDIRGGNCVMLTQGKLEAETVYSKDPAFIAKMFQAKGAKRIHIVDLDGAFSGSPQNIAVIEKIRQAVTVEIEFGGGVRKIETIEKMLNIGIDKIIIGTVAVFNPDVVKEAVKKFKDKIIIAIDVFDDKIAIGGWKEVTQYNALEFAKNMKEIGITEIITTDVMRDGMMEGPNIEGIKRICKSGVSVIASGGVSRLEDVEKIASLEKLGVSGMIIGKALYNDSIKLEDAIKICLPR